MPLLSFSQCQVLGVDTAASGGAALQGASVAVEACATASTDGHVDVAGVLAGKVNTAAPAKSHGYLIGSKEFDTGGAAAGTLELGDIGQHAGNIYLPRTGDGRRELPTFNLPFGVNTAASRHREVDITS